MVHFQDTKLYPILIKTTLKKFALGQPGPPRPKPKSSDMQNRPGGRLLPDFPKLSPLVQAPWLLHLDPSPRSLQALLPSRQARCPIRSPWGRVEALLLETPSFGAREGSPPARTAGPASLGGHRDRLPRPRARPCPQLFHVRLGVAEMKRLSWEGVRGRRLGNNHLASL